jgi:hypothetical protein
MTGNSLWPDFWIGVGAGAAASALFSIATFLLKAVVEKIYQEFSRRHAEKQLMDISGEWKSIEEVDKETYTYSEDILLKQKGPDIEGTLNYCETRPDSVRIRKVFKLSGTYRERSLTISYRTEDRRSASSGSITMQLKDDNTMVGGCVYYDGDSGEVSYDPYTWTRSKR